MSSLKLYTAAELKRKFAGKFINTLPHFYERRDARGNWITLYEVQSVKNHICENHNLPEDEIIN